MRVGSSQTLSTPQDELLEIIHDFKNNVLTINEVENLVETWKNRHDVQQSFKEKQVSAFYLSQTNDNSLIFKCQYIYCNRNNLIK